MTSTPEPTPNARSLLRLTVEPDGAISRIAGGPLEEAIDTGPTPKAQEDMVRNADYRAGYRAGYRAALSVPLAGKSAGATWLPTDLGQNDEPSKES